MSEPSKLNVEIYGHIYTLRVTPEEKTQVEAITAHVDQMMHKVGDDQTRLDYRDVAVLAAMNITEEYFKLQREYQELLSIVDEEK